MRLASLAMLVGFAVGSASAQRVSDPTPSKSEVTQNAQDAVKLGVSEVGTDMNRSIQALQGELQSEAQKEARADRAVAGGAKPDKAKDPAAKPCKDCVAPAKPH